MFEILIYLFETYIHNESEVSIDYECIAHDLSNIGFKEKDIYKSLHWLKSLSCYKKNIISSFNIVPSYMPTRIYTKDESLRLNIDCRGFILFLEQLEILTLDTREMIIEKIMALDVLELYLEDFKWIVLIVLFNVPGCEVAYEKLEGLLFHVKRKTVH